jgi:hypothetical protein
MLVRRKHIRIINPDSVILMMILVLGLLIFQKTDMKSNKSRNIPVQRETLLTQNNATICAGVHLQFLRQTWISNKDKFKLLAFDKVQILENKKVDQKIELFENALNNSLTIPNFIILCHLFPQEKDEIPVLS